MSSSSETTTCDSGWQQDYARPRHNPALHAAPLKMHHVLATDTCTLVAAVGDSTHGRLDGVEAFFLLQFQDSSIFSCYD